MKHKAIRIDNLMYKGCEPHWKCKFCGEAVPFHCYTKEEFENHCCGCKRIRCDDCKENGKYVQIEIDYGEEDNNGEKID